MLDAQNIENNLSRSLPSRLLRPFLLGFVLLIAVLTVFAKVSLADPPDPGFAVQFDGQNDNMVLGQTSLIMSEGWTTTKTVEVWVKPMGTASCSLDLLPEQCSVATVDAIFGDRARWWGISRGTIGGQDKIWIWNWGTDGQRSIGIDYTVGEWVHIALVHGDGVLHAYKNGVEVGSGISSEPTIRPTGPGGQPNPTVLYVGGIMNTITRTWAFSGAIDEVRIWNTARTATELVENMNIPLTGGETGLAAYYQMSNGTGSITVTDNSGSGWTATLQDGTAVVPPNGTLPQWVTSYAFSAPMPNLPPTADSQSVGTPEDTAVAITLTGTDPNTDTLTFTVTVSPSHGLLGGTPPNLVYTPNNNYNGGDSFSYIADDGQATSAPATATITISAVNDAPDAQDDIAGTLVNLATTIPVLDNDDDVDGDSLQVVALGSAQNGTATTNGTTVIYTPTTAFTGTDYFTYTINDGSVSPMLIDTANVTVTVAEANVPPIAVDDTAQTPENTSMVIDVLVNDSDPDNSGPLTVSRLGVAAHGVVTNNISSVSYQPDTAFVGTDVFTYEMFDSVTGYDSATVTVTVTAVNNPPDAVDDYAYTALDTGTTIDALANDSDAEGDPFSIVSIGNATHGVAVNNGVDITYTPTLSFSGIDVFTYTIQDNHAGTDTASITVSVGAGYALQFDGEDDYVQLAESYNLMTPSWTTTKTVEVWVKPMGSSGCSVAANLCLPNVVDSIFGDRPRAWGISRGVVSGQDKIWVWNNDSIGGGGALDSIAVDYTVGEWIHIALVHANGMLTAYKNGVEVGSVPSGDSVDFGGNILFIGGIVSGSRHWVFDGVIDEVRVWNVGRSAAEIAANVNRSLAGNEPGLVAYYKMSDGAGTSLTDDSGNGWTGTLADEGGGTQVLPQWVTSGAFTAPEPPAPPIADSQSVSTPEDTPLAITLTGSDPNGDTITFTLTSQPSHGILGGTPPNLVFTPATNYNGVTSFSYVASDGELTSDPATTTITVSPENDPPTAVDDTTSALVNIPLTISVLTNDDDIDGDSFYISAVGNPQNGETSSDGNTVVFTATAVGTEYFTYTISDGSLSDTAQVTVTVLSSNTPPTAVDDIVSTSVNVPVTINARDNDSDPDGGTFSITSLGTVPHGTASTDGNIIVFTPTNDYVGDTSFPYTITDNLGGTDSATVTVHINATTIFLPLVLR